MMTVPLEPMKSVAGEWVSKGSEYSYACIDDEGEAVDDLEDAHLHHRGQAGPLTEEQLNDGDAVLEAALAPGVPRAFYYVRKRGNNVTYHWTREGAEGSEDDCVHHLVVPGRILSQSELANEVRKFIYKGKVYPRSVTDIRDSVSVVVWHAIAVLIFGLVPGAGTIPMLAVTLHYGFGSHHMYMWPPDPNRLRCFRTAGLRQTWSMLLALFLMLQSSLGPLLNVQYFHDMYFELVETHTTDKREALFKADLLQEQMRGISLVCSISTLFLDRILVTNIMRVFADIAYYKALAEENMVRTQSKARDILDGLRQRFGTVYETRSAPRNIDDRYFSESIGLLRRCVVVVSTICMTVGLIGAYLNYLHVTHVLLHKNLPLVQLGVAMLSFILIGVNWYTLSTRTFGASSKLHRKGNQLLLFRALSRRQDYTSWDEAAKSKLKEILKIRLQSIGETGVDNVRRVLRGNSERCRRNTEKASLQCVISRSEPHDFDRWLKDELPNDSMDTQDEINRFGDLITVIPDRLLNHLVVRLIFGSAGPHERRIATFDLHKVEDLSQWWSLRQYLLLDFVDESCTVDYSIATTLILLVCFVCNGILGWIAQKDLFIQPLGVAMNKVSEEAYWMHVLQRYIPIAATVVVMTIVATLCFMFADLTTSCVDINRLLAQDAQMLLDTKLEVQLRACMTGRQGGRSSFWGDGRLNMSETGGSGTPTSGLEANYQPLVVLISTMLEHLAGSQEKQKLFGFVVDCRLRNCLMVLGLLVLAILSVCLQQLYQREQ